MYPNKIWIDRIVPVAMIVAWIIAVTFDAYFSKSEHFLAVSDASYEGASVRHPFEIYLVANVAAGLAVIVGGIMKILRQTYAVPVLLVGALLTFLSFGTFDVVVYTDVSAASTFVFSLLLGWLIAAREVSTSHKVGE